MRKPIKLLIVLFASTLLFAACVNPSVTNIDTDEAKTLIQNVKELDPSIEKVKIIYSRQSYAPEFISIDVFCRNQPAQKIVDLILDHTKQFITVENVNRMKLPSSVDVDVFLRIHTDNEKDEPFVQYSTTYYKSNDHTDDSPENIDGFQTWVKGEQPD